MMTDTDSIEQTTSSRARYHVFEIFDVKFGELEVAQFKVIQGQR